MKRNIIPLFKVFMSPNLKDVINDVLYSGYIGEGEQVILFEEALSKFLKNPNIVTVNSGTSALHLAYHMALHSDSRRPHKIDSEAEIISTPITCTATNTPIISHGAKIVWADVDPVTGNIDPADIEKKITKKTKAISVVHWGGNPCKIDEVSIIGKQYNIKVIEDAAHSLGAMHNKEPVGTISDYTCFSFQAIKHLTTIDGGCLAVKNEEDSERAKLLRWYGIDRNNKNQADLRCEIDIEETGYKFHMNNVSAAVGIQNIRHLEWILDKHRQNAYFYDEAFSGVDRITIPEITTNCLSSYWLYTIHVNNQIEFIDKMKDSGIVTSKVHSRNDLHSCFRNSLVDLPNAEKFNNSHVCIPVGWWIEPQEREYIAEQAIKNSK